MGLLALVVIVVLGLLVVALRRGGAASMSPRTLASFTLLVVIILVLGRSVRVIPAGSVGVVDLFGRVSPVALSSGIQFANPLARVVTMSVKTQELKEIMDVPSKEGLSMNVECSVLYHLDPERAADVYRTIGQDYVPVILEPQFRSVTRGVTAAYEARALYTSEREHLAQLITGDLQKVLAPRGVVIESTPLRRLTLPQRITTAIEEKLSATRRVSAWSSSC
jgi:regulator of protease activity HflC (stomatin/prohibitin superfamily)